MYRLNSTRGACSARIPTLWDPLAPIYIRWKRKHARDPFGALCPGENYRGYLDTPNSTDSIGDIRMSPGDSSRLDHPRMFQSLGFRESRIDMGPLYGFHKVRDKRGHHPNTEMIIIEITRRRLWLDVDLKQRVERQSIIL